MKKIKVLMLIDVFNSLGGGELFLSDLIKSFDNDSSIEFIGIACQILNCNSSLYPIKIYTIEESLQLDFDVLMFSGNLHIDILKQYQNKIIRILLAQSDFNVNWYHESCKNFYTHVIGVSKSTINSIKTSKLKKVILPGINFQNFYENTNDKKLELGLDKNSFAVGYFGRLERLKNIEMIIDALKDLVDTKFIIIGNGKEQENILNYGYKKLKDRLIFLPQVNYKYIGEYYRSLDVFCLTSKGEGCPRVMWESLYFGIPFITTPVGAAKDIINDSCGKIINTVDELITAVEHFKNKPVDRTNLKNIAISQGDIELTYTHFKSFINKTCASLKLN